MEAPEFERSLNDVWVKVGEPLSLECKVTGLPLTETLWLRDGQEVSHPTWPRAEQIEGYDSINHVFTMNCIA